MRVKKPSENARAAAAAVSRRAPQPPRDKRSIALEADLSAFVVAYAAQTGLSQSAVVNAALDLFREVVEAGGGR